MADITRAQFRFWLQMPTRWGDEDRLGHINNAKFFTYDESARIAYFDRYKASQPDFFDGAGLIVANIGCDFIAQLHHPATLEIGLRVARIGGSSLRTQGGLFVGEKLIAVTRGVLVWFDYRAQKSVVIPQQARAAIRGYEVIAPEE